MRNVLFAKYIPAQKIEGQQVAGTNKMSDLIYKGKFHQWGLEMEDYGTGCASFTVAIVEDEDGVIHNPCVHHVKFVDADIPDPITTQPPNQFNSINKTL